MQLSRIFRYLQIEPLEDAVCPTWSRHGVSLS